MMHSEVNKLHLGKMKLSGMDNLGAAMQRQLGFLLKCAEIN